MSKYPSRQAGFSTGLIIAAVLVLAVIGGTGFVVFKKSTSKQATTTPPTTDTKATVDEPDAEPEQPATYEGMTQYTNEKFGLSFYFPNEWRVEERDPTLTADPEKTELSLWLVDKNAKERSEAGIVSVIARDLANAAPGVHGNIDDYRESLTLKGKTAAKYTFPQSKSVNRVMYHFAVGDKTYTIGTIYETQNIERAPDYMAKFDKVVESLRLP
jgi:hypothetical protein